MPVHIIYDEADPPHSRISGLRGLNPLCAIFGNDNKVVAKLPRVVKGQKRDEKI